MSICTAAGLRSGMLAGPHLGRRCAVGMLVRAHRAALALEQRRHRLCLHFRACCQFKCGPVVPDSAVLKHDAQREGHPWCLAGNAEAGLVTEAMRQLSSPQSCEHAAQNRVTWRAPLPTFRSMPIMRVPTPARSAGGTPRVPSAARARCHRRPRRQRAPGGSAPRAPPRQPHPAPRASTTPRPRRRRRRRSARPPAQRRPRMRDQRRRAGRPGADRAPARPPRPRRVPLAGQARARARPGSR